MTERLHPVTLPEEVIRLADNRLYIPEPHPAYVRAIAADALMSGPKWRRGSHMSWVRHAAQLSASALAVVRAGTPERCYFAMVYGRVLMHRRSVLCFKKAKWAQQAVELAAVGWALQKAATAAGDTFWANVTREERERFDSAMRQLRGALAVATETWGGATITFPITTAGMTPKGRMLAEELVRSEIARAA